MSVRTVLKQPEKNFRRDPGEKGWACYYCGKEGHLKWDCPQVSNHPRLRVWSARDHTGVKTAPRGIGFKKTRTEGARGVPTQAAFLITSEEPLGANPSVSFCTLGQLTLCSRSPGPLSARSASTVGPSERAKRHYFSRL